jgi:hypothetical protein
MPGAEMIDSPTPSWPGLTWLDPAILARTALAKDAIPVGDNCIGMVGWVKPGHDAVGSSAVRQRSV